LRTQISERTGARSKGLRAHVQRRLDFALSGFHEQIASVTVRLSRADPTKMTNGAGKRCEIEVRLHPRSVGVEDTDVDLVVAIDNASRRLRRSLTRALDHEPAPPAPDQPRPRDGRGRRPR
jgi:ribosome-associated translation inhibitor RaiA